MTVSVPATVTAPSRPDPWCVVVGAGSTQWAIAREPETATPSTTRASSRVIAARCVGVPAASRRTTACSSGATQPSSSSRGAVAVE